TENLEPLFTHGWQGVVAGAGLVIVSYAGVTKVCSVAEEVHKPEVNLPAGMILAQVTAMIIYTVVATVITGNLDLGSFAGAHGHDGHPPAELLTPVATAAEAFWGRPGVVAMAITAAAGLLSMSNAGIMASSRYPFAMARDGLMPSTLAAVHPKLGTPVVAILFTGAITLLAVTALPVEELAHLASAFTLFVFCLVNLAVVALRESGARWYKPSFRTPLYPWLPLSGVAIGTLLLAYMGTTAVIAVVAATVGGTLWYFLYARTRLKRGSVVTHLWAERARVETEHFEAEEAELTYDQSRVITPVFDNQPTPIRLVHLAAAFVDEGAVLEVMRVEEVPDQTSLGALLGSDSDLDALQEEARDAAGHLHVDLAFHDLLTHNAKHALFHRAEATHADWIVAPWPERRNLAAWIRHPLAWWADDPPCDHAQFLDRGQDPLRRILVLVQPGPYDTVLVHVADRLARATGGELTLFSAADPVEAYREYHKELARLCEVPVHSEVHDVAADQLVKFVTGLTPVFDLVIMGAETERGLAALTKDSRVDRIAAESACSVLRIKAPRHRVYPYVDFRGLEGEVLEDEDLVVIPSLSTSSQADLFTRLAGRLVEDGETTTSVEEALWERERKQSTALSTGLMVSTGTHSGLARPRAAVVTLERPVRFGTPDRHRVDVCLVVLAPPGQRNRQLWLVHELYPVLSRPDVLESVRAASTPEQIRKLLTPTRTEQAS
ncbi:MAG: amino acid permease, partial [Myxococcota bacterium]